LGDTGELLLGTIEMEEIRFVSKQRHDGEKVIWLGLRLKNTEPMKKALSGLMGTITGVDYRREMVLAAYTPIASLNLGLVAKIDLMRSGHRLLKQGYMVLLLRCFLLFSGSIVRHGQEKN
jgi:hypothetical protein